MRVRTGLAAIAKTSAPGRSAGCASWPRSPGERITAVAVVGLGAMGRRIAIRLVAAGHKVIVWNRSAGKTEPLAELGAVPAASPPDRPPS